MVRAGVGGAIRSGSVLRAAAVVVALLICEGVGFAHYPGVSSGEYRLEGRVVQGEVGITGREMLRALPELDRNHDGEIDSAELAAGGAAVGGFRGGRPRRDRRRASLRRGARPGLRVGGGRRAPVSGSVHLPRRPRSAHAVHLVRAERSVPGTVTWRACLGTGRPKRTSSIAATPHGRWRGRPDRAPSGWRGRW